ncbi:MAG: AAA family ATPase [Campylobacterota bacterium]|nr:AAA family ATPase [Campylobacterota bacterium]
MKLKVEQLAKIEEATIDIKNLTVFVGKNSTNKSYMAHTVYMVNKVLSQFIGGGYNDYNIDLLNTYIKTTNAKEDIKLLRTTKRTLTNNKEQLEVDVDQYEFINIRKVILDLSSIELAIIIDNIENFFINHILNSLNHSFNISQSIIKNIVFKEPNKNIDELFEDNKLVIRNQDKENIENFALMQIFSKIKEEFFKYSISEKEFYFPASRTGFVLTFDEIVSGVLRSRFGGQPTATKLSEPTIDFISKFADIKSGKYNEVFNIPFDMITSISTEIKKLFEFMEKRIVKGKIIEEKTAQNYTHFYLETPNKQKLDLHLSSSASVELLPLIIFLKHFETIDDRLLVIEEPEAHLHPKAQIEMARLLVMLSNAGAKVLITTHSDYILNEISNCIKLSNATDEKKQAYLDRYELDEDTVISASDVSAYLFKDIEGDKIEVDELTIDEYGIANDNFDDILDELLERTDEINEMVL